MLAAPAATDRPMHAQSPHARCGAKTRSGEPCRLPPVAGGTRCRMHGGSGQLGTANPSFRHGRYSKLVPARLAAAYEAARTDDDLLALRDEAAVLQARIGDLLGRVDSGDSRRLWADAAAALDDLETAIRATDRPGIVAALGRLRDAIGHGQRDWQTWAEIQQTIEGFRKVSESERKRLVEMQAMVTADEAMAFAAALIAEVQANVGDPEALARIQAGMRRVFEERRGR